MSLARDTTNFSTMTFKDGSDRYEIVSGNGRFWLHAFTVRGHFAIKLEPAAVRGLRILKDDNEDAVLAICKAIVPE